MIKDYFVHIPPTLAEVLADIGGTSADDDFDTIVNAAVQDFFSFYTPQKIVSGVAVALEKFVLNYFIMRRIGSGNVRKWKQLFRNRWNAIIPYYERLLETQENESEYFANPILNVDMSSSEEGSGTRETDTDRDRTNRLVHTGSGTHATDETTSGTHSGREERETENEGTKTHSGSNTESGSNSEINRYSDTPQGDSSDIWEVDAQGHPVLTDIYLTDIRGITGSDSSSGSDTYTDNTTGTGSETKTDSATDSGTLDRDETMTDTFTDDATENENTGVDENTTHTNASESAGYNGKSPVELMQLYRESFMRIYESIAEELEPCFYSLVEVDDLTDFV